MRTRSLLIPFALFVGTLGALALFVRSVARSLTGDFDEVSVENYPGDD